MNAIHERISSILEPRSGLGQPHRFAEARYWRAEEETTWDDGTVFTGKQSWQPVNWSEWRHAGVLLDMLTEQWDVMIGKDMLILAIPDDTPADDPRTSGFFVDRPEGMTTPELIQAAFLAWKIS